MSLTLLYAFGCTQKEEIITPPPPVTDTIGVKIHYNDTDWEYDQNYSFNVIDVITVLPDRWPETNEMQANTGLAYLQNTNELLIVAGKGNEKKLDRKFNEQMLAYNFTNQGIGYDPNNNLLLVLGTGSISFKTFGNSVVKTLNFPSPQPSPGMIFYDWVNERACVSYDNISKVYIWDVSGSAAVLYREINISGAQEGAAIDYLTETIWINRNGNKAEIDYDGNVLFSIAVPGNTGSVNEGLAVDPTDGTLWFNSDEYYHGGIIDGNRLWHIDPKKRYNKYLRVPHQIKWQWGKKTNLDIVGTLHKSTIQVSQGQSQGEWISPVIDFEDYTMQRDLENYAILSGATIQFRGASIEPTTLKTDIFPIHFFDANQSNEGWGTTVPGAWQSTPVTNQYMQIRITLLK